MHQALIALTAVAITATALASPQAHASPSQPAPPKVAIVISPLPSQVEMEATLRRASQAHEAEQFAKVMAGQALDDSIIYVSGRYTAQCPHGVVQGRLDSRYPQMKDPCGRPFPWAP